MDTARWGKAVVCLIVLAMPAAGCSMLVPTAEPVTISFVHPVDPGGVYERWAQEFQEANPHVTVELVSRQDVSGGSLLTHDAFVATQFEVSQYVSANAVVDLTGFIEQDEELNVGDFYPAALDVFSVQGRQWALPFGIDMLMVYYNKDIFDRYSAAYPQVGWDWGDFLDAAISVTDPGADIFGYGLHHESEFAAYEPVVLIYQHGGRIFDNLQAPTMATLDDPYNIEAMEFYASLIYDHGVSPTPEEAQRMGSPYPWRAVFQQQVAMWATMLSERGGSTWPMAWNFNWGVVPMPRDAVAGTLALSDGFFISAESENPDVTWAWISFLSQKIPPFQMPARPSLAQSSAYEQAVGSEVAAAAQAAIGGAILVNPEILGFETAVNAMAEAFAQIRSGEVTPEIALVTA
ncbi:MAG: sugar ABC transporter substrate-binding protein, partial [Anaerolineae bacterium]|nr:sugar ABC transporter substrate-binding protein [Anaerolineae bacterium]